MGIESERYRPFGREVNSLWFRVLSRLALGVCCGTGRTRFGGIVSFLPACFGVAKDSSRENGWNGEEISPPLDLRAK